MLHSHNYKKLVFIFLVFSLLCACGQPLPDFSAHTAYGLSAYPGAGQGTDVYAYLQSVAPQGAGTADVPGLSTAFDSAVLADAQIPALDSSRPVTLGIDTGNCYNLSYWQLDGRFVTASYLPDGNFLKCVRIGTAGQSFVLQFDSRNQSVSRITAALSPA